MFVLLQLLSLLLFYIDVASTAQFWPDTTDYNAYGLKVAANNLMIVEVKNDLTEFLIQFEPYTDKIPQTTERVCAVEYDDPSLYVYTIALGRNQSTYEVFFVGEVVDLDEEDRLANRTFVGVLSYNGSPTNIDCVNGFYFSIQFVSDAFAHQERLVMTTDPFGLVAYGFSNLFTFTYTASTNRLIVDPRNSLSPTIAFFPSAVDYDGARGIIAGFLDNGRNSRIKYSATIILFSIDASTAIVTPISSWGYPTNGTTWQARQNNAGADQYAAKFDMSVSISSITRQVLTGIQLMNTVVLFNYTTASLVFVTSIENGQGIGFGKGVAWLSHTLHTFAVLVNVYSSTYAWSSSRIHVYANVASVSLPPMSIFPNNQQPLYSYMSPVFLNILTTPTDLVLLDNAGGLFVILSAGVGDYASTIGPDDQLVPAFSSPRQCIPGTYKNTIGIGRCLPCPTGSKNDGTNRQVTTCVACANNTFCPFGSTSDSIGNDLLQNATQAMAYPKSPDITELDDILFLNLFSLSSSSRCLLISPTFWALIVAAIVILIGSFMFVMKYCIKHPRAAVRYKMLTNAFRRTDIIGEGDMWIGGLATFCVLVLIISCYVFSAKYYQSYPLETTGPSTYTCDTSTRNAKFSSTLQSSVVPVSAEFQEMINLLNDQPISLNVAFLNTIYNCTSDPIAVTYLVGTTWMPVSKNISCNSSNYMLSLSALLPFKQVTVQVNLLNTYLIGGLRIGLSAPGQVRSSTTLRDLDFSQTFTQNGHMLGQRVDVLLQLTKVINDTTPLTTNGNDQLSGLWIGSFSMNYYESFWANEDYLNAMGETSTNVTLFITENSYYILNIQEPITKLSQLVFHNILFTTTIIELFGLIFLIFKLVFIPLLALLIRRWKTGLNHKYPTNTTYTSTDNSKDHDQQKLPSCLNEQDSIQHQHDNTTPARRQIFTISDDTHQQKPSVQYRQAYL